MSNEARDEQSPVSGADAGSTAPDARAKRYIVFASDDYYPRGGWADYVGTTDDYDEAHRLGREARRDEYHVVDLHDLERDCDAGDAAR